MKRFLSLPFALIGLLALLGPLPVATQASESPAPDLATVLEEDPRLRMLAVGLRSSNLMSVVRGTDGVTFFAPTNRAILDLPDGRFQRMQLNFNAGIFRDILRYQMVPGRIDPAEEIGEALRTREGQFLPFTRSAEGVLKVGDAAIAGPPVETATGRVYPVDAVIFPPDFRPTDLLPPHGPGPGPYSRYPHGPGPGAYSCCPHGPGPGPYSR
jgi:uncharacterized surface protein with fasciclin (FAS1) repeats